MTFPNFNERGVMPRGLHKCSPQEFINRFCYQIDEIPVRAAYSQVIEQLFGHSIERGAKSIIFGGSFITNEKSPNDIDCIVILPNEHCIPHKSGIVIMADCKLDIVYAIENDKSMVSRIMNMFTRDRYELEVGLVEVLLKEDFVTSWDYFYGEFSFDELLEERAAYINRHFIIGSNNRGLLITIHGINSDAHWNFDFAPIASANNWIFAPFNYGNVTLPLVNHKLKLEVMNNFRGWVKNIFDKYKITPSIFTHSFGTFIIGSYLKEFNYEPPIKFKNIILAGSILNPNYDWIKAFEKGCVQSVLNIISPNDPFVPHIEKAKWIHNEELYGTAGTSGFTQLHPRLFSERINIYDHSNMLKTDIFDSKIMPFLNTIINFQNLNSDWRYMSDNAFKKFLGQ